MTEDKTTITENEVIATFAGWTRLQTEYDVFFNDQGKPCTLDNWTFHLNHLDFHSNWQRLMPVWYKFRDLNMDLALPDYKTYKRYWYELANDIPRKPIADVCKLLAEGIRWYNSVKK